MCNRSYGSAVLISMASYQGESCKTGMHSLQSFLFADGAIAVADWTPEAESRFIQVLQVHPIRLRCQF
jgi:hypothetical protein